jgi:hypothetical protein
MTITPLPIRGEMTMLSREQHDAQEEIYEILLKEVETLCEGGVPASDITHA